MGSLSEASGSPKWGPTTKLIVGLTLAAAVAALLIYFRNIIGPLLLAFILTYLLHPLAVHLSDASHLSWRASVNLIYLIVVILVVAFFTITGLAIAQQIQNLLLVIDRFLTNLPTLAMDLSNRIYKIGPFQLDTSQLLDLQALSQWLLSAVQPMLGRVGGLVSTFAASAAVTFGWGLFVLVISYFLLADATRVSDDLVFIHIPGYDLDIRRLSMELRRIWNSFLRNQIIIVGLVILAYSVLLTILGVRYALAIAILAGLAVLVPYVGPLITWIVVSLVTFFQPGNYFGLQPFHYTILVLACGIILNQVFDSLISPRVLGRALGVHPAAVLIAALVAARVIGLIGLLIAAPTVATLKLLLQYTGRKMLDLDPWPEPPDIPVQPTESSWLRGRRQVQGLWRKFYRHTE